MTLSSSIRGNLPLNKWRHIAIAYDGSREGKGIQIFVDGKQRTDTAHRGKLRDGQKLRPVDSSQTRLHFSSNPYGIFPQFGGEALIDELRIYDRKLTDEEIKQVMAYESK
ncbi:MAG: LamG-like jellyroll fold domain-containing protein [Mariniblastus sp.]